MTPPLKQLGEWLADSVAKLTHSVGFMYPSHNIEIPSEAFRVVDLNQSGTAVTVAAEAVEDDKRGLNQAHLD
jgi:hypothetical protein